MTAVMSFCGLCLLLVLGKLLRAAVPLFQKLYLPSSVIGGLLGLALIDAGNRLCPGSGLEQWTAGWDKLPGFLINIVFAAIFVGSPIPKLKRIWNLAAPQLCFGQICAWGQYVVGLGLAGLLLVPLFHVNPAFGTLLEIGFEGGHGTVGGLSSTFEHLGWPEGYSLGLTVATCGMIVGVSLGMALINLAKRRNWLAAPPPEVAVDSLKQKGIYRLAQQPSAGKQTVCSESIDSLAFHVALIGIAVLLGYGIKYGLLKLNTVMPASVRELRVLESFPLFPLCMIGGLLLQLFLRKVRLTPLVNAMQIQRFSGATLDFLVLSAVASIKIEFVLANWMPLLLLVLAGTAWNLFCVLYFGPRMFHDAWFERSIAEFGQASGVTATGLLLLRTVDPESRTAALKSFGYKQLLHEPFMGGGIWTSIALPLVVSRGNLFVWFICAGALLVWLVLWLVFFRPASRKKEETVR